MYPLTFDTSIVIFRFFYDKRIMAITDIILININKNRYPHRIVSDDVSFNNNTMGVTSGTVTANSSRAHGFIPGS
jgi:flagellar basal body L-ring protein FlgH